MENRLCFMASTFTCVKLIYQLSCFELSLSGRMPVRRHTCSAIAAKDQHLLENKMDCLEHLGMSEISSVMLV